ncbi:hypothetical protein Brsp06_04429 [Brucella sp. NBRC 13694]
MRKLSHFHCDWVRQMFAVLARVPLANWLIVKQMASAVKVRVPSEYGFQKLATNQSELLWQ